MFKSVDVVARRFEEVQKVDALVAVSTSVTLAATRATKSVPIVFYAGADAVSSGLIDSFRRPGGRLTGIHRQSTDLTAKRLELLKEMVPTLRRVVTFYRPDNSVAQRSVKIARDAARQLNLELVERPVASVGDLRAGLRALRPGEAEALFLVSDAMVSSQTELLVEMARTKRLPTMVQDGASVGSGALAAYGESFYTVGRLSAKHVQRILEGAKPGELPVEQVENVYFVIFAFPRSPWTFAVYRERLGSPRPKGLRTDHRGRSKMYSAVATATAHQNHAHENDIP